MSECGLAGKNPITIPNPLPRYYARRSLRDTVPALSLAYQGECVHRTALGTPRGLLLRRILGISAPRTLKHQRDQLPILIAACLAIVSCAGVGFGFATDTATFAYMAWTFGGIGLFTAAGVVL